MKQLIDAGVYQYPLTPEGLEEARADATVKANDSEKPTWARKYRQTMYVLQDQNGYYGPVNNARRQSLGYQGLSIAATIGPES
jgi:hypothetical protein